MSGRATARRPRALAGAKPFTTGALLIVLLAGYAVARAGDLQPDSEAPATAAEPRVTGIRPGFAGKFKVGYWNPFFVELEGGSMPVRGQLELIVPDGDGVPSRVPAAGGEIVSLAPGEKKSIAAYAKLGQLGGSLTVNLRDEQTLLASRTFVAGTNGPLAGILPSSQPLAVAVGNALGPADERALEQRGLRLARLEQVADLPDAWWGYEGIDTVILSAVDAQSAGQWTSAGPRLAALELWVRLGGQVLVNVGDEAPNLLAAGKPLAGLAPGVFDSLVPLRQTSFIETYAETAETLAAPAGLSIVKLTGVDGKVEAFAGASARDLPLVVRSAQGFGEVVFVAFDLASPGVQQWTGRPQLLGKLLGRTETNVATAPDAAGLGEVTTLGFVDLSGQLRGALDQFPGVWSVPFWLVALLVSAYIVCIGPLDYWLVKRLFKRMETTWLTFAFTVLLFSAGGVALAMALKGRDVRLNQVDLVDFDAQTKLLRGTTWFNVYSPQIDEYNLSPKPLAAVLPAGAEVNESGLLFSWSGLPGEGFGGIDTGGRALARVDSSWRGTSLFTEPYDFAPRFDRLKDVPIAVWSSKAFVARWWQPGDSPIAATLSLDDRLLGTLKNNLPMALTNVVLIYDKWAYVIRNLTSGETLDLDDVDPQTVETYLRHVIAQRDQQISAPYDPAAFDVPRIVEIMTAHQLTGGQKYTGLTHQYQAFTELSRSVRDGQAVLIGRAERPAVELERDGKPLDAQQQQWTFYRFVFPVRAATSGSRSN